MDFSELGIEFKVISSEMIPAVLDFMEEHHLPHEPMSRSLGFTRNWLTDEMYFKDAINDGTSIAAVDKHGNILATRIAKIIKRNDWFGWIVDMILKHVFTRILWLLGDLTSMKNLWIMLLIIDFLEFDSFAMMKQLECGSIYEAKALCSARTHGVRGLGTELVRRGEELARSRGVNYANVMVTGVYSAKVFDRLGYTKLKELEYAEFRDERGDLYLKETREHTHCGVYLKSLQ